MPVSTYIKETMTSKGAGVIRKMFEEGIRLKKEYGDDKVFDFSLGNPDLDPPEEVSAEFARIAGSREKNFHGYMPNAGYMETRNAMAEKTSLEQEYTEMTNPVEEPTPEVPSKPEDESLEPTTDNEDGNQ